MLKKWHSCHSFVKAKKTGQGSEIYLRPEYQPWGSQGAVRGPLGGGQDSEAGSRGAGGGGQEVTNDSKAGAGQTWP